MQRNYRKEIEELLAQLKQERDELNVKLHLAKVEARDQWEVAEKQWYAFQHKSEKVLGEVDHTGDEVKQALTLLADELKDGYRRIREQMR